jgi:hypothetical protein
VLQIVLFFYFSLQFKESLKALCEKKGVTAVIKDAWTLEQSGNLQEATKKFKMQLRKCFNLQCQQKTIESCQKAMKESIESNLNLLENPSCMRNDALKTLECFKFFLDHEFPEFPEQKARISFQHDFFL